MSTCTITLESSSKQTTFQTPTTEVNRAMPSFDPAAILKQFDEQYAERLARRGHTFRRVFEELLSKRQTSYTIVETGMFHVPGAWGAQGLSTLLFDWFINQTAGSIYSVDIDPAAIAATREHVSNRCVTVCADSVAFLGSLHLDKPIDLLYLDSFDLDPKHPTPAAVHQLKEMAAAMHLCRSGTIILSDDWISAESGKGIYVAELLDTLGARRLFTDYQVAWVMP